MGHCRLWLRFDYDRKIGDQLLSYDAKTACDAAQIPYLVYQMLDKMVIMEIGPPWILMCEPTPFQTPTERLLSQARRDEMRQGMTWESIVCSQVCGRHWRRNPERVRFKARKRSLFLVSLSLLSAFHLVECLFYTTGDHANSIDAFSTWPVHRQSKAYSAIELACTESGTSTHRSLCAEANYNTDQCTTNK